MPQFTQGYKYVEVWTGHIRETDAHRLSNGIPGGYASVVARPKDYFVWTGHAPCGPGSVSLNLSEEANRILDAAFMEGYEYVRFHPEGEQLAGAPRFEWWGV